LLWNNFGSVFVSRCHGLTEIKGKHNSYLDKIKTLFYEISYSVRLCLFIYFLAMFDDNLLTVAMRRIFSRRTHSLVALDSESLYKGKMHRKTLGRNKEGQITEVLIWSLRQVWLYNVQFKYIGFFFWQDQENQASCKACPAGYYCISNSTDYSDKSCPSGHYCPTSTEYDTQYPCPVGTFNNLTGQ
jgi:hypothetical protein